MFFWLAGHVLTGHAQEELKLPEIIPASPEAAAIAKYINYPVDYSTGLVKIEIPLYEIKAGEITLPITLSYHASGIKVNENSGWVGIGWTLNAEPSVSRSVRGLPDEKTHGGVGYLKNTKVGANDCIYEKNMADGGADEEPDDFYYRLLDRSGGFFFKKSGSAVSRVTVPYDPVEITHGENSINQINRIEIKDEKGIHYLFQDILETTGKLTGAVETNVAVTGWKVSRIISGNKADTLSFGYDSSGETIYNNGDMVIIEDSTSISAQYNPLGCSNVGFPYVASVIQGQSDNTVYAVENSGELTPVNGCRFNSTVNHPNSYVRSRKLAEIRYRGGTVYFYSTGREQARLKYIVIADNNGRKIRTIEFETSDFGIYTTGTSTPTSEDARFKLDAIRIKNSKNEIIETYRFGYEFNQLPLRKSRDYDHWGYYNGAGNTTAVPRCETGCILNNDSRVNIAIGGAEKEANEATMRCGMLKTIIYPTGGETHFTYEPHQYKTENGGIVQCGGLRIASIHDIPNDMDAGTYRIFKYGKDEEGDGISRWKVACNDYMSQYDKNYGGAIGTSRVRTYYSSSLTDLFYSAGAPVMYEQVTEYRSPDIFLNNTTGKTVYTYNVNAEYPVRRFELSPYYENNRGGWLIGQLIRKETFNRDGDTLSRTVYQYRNFKTDIMGSARIAWRKTVGPLDASGCYEDGVVMLGYLIQSGARKLEAETAYERWGGKWVKTEKRYEYNSLLFPSKIKTLTSQNVYITDEYQYAPDKQLTGDAEVARSRLVADRKLNTLIKQTRTHIDKEQVTQYQYRLFNDKALLSAVEASTGPGRAMETRIRYYAYDPYTNPVTVSYEGGPKVSYLWGYKKQHPVLKITNAGEQEFRYYSFEEGPEGTKGMSAAGDKYRNGSMVIDFMLPNNREYVIDYYYRSDGKWHYKKQAYTGSFTLQEGNALDEIRIYPADAQVTTYTCQPLVGVTSETDTAGHIIYYEYDRFGRLARIKDQNGKVLKEHRYHYRESN
jgi:YD repeat-containing protein